MTVSSTSVSSIEAETAGADSRPSCPTLDLHTDAIMLREGRGAVCSSYMRESSSSLALDAAALASRPSIPSLPSETSASLASATPTASEPSPFPVRRSAFRAPPAVITVGPSPAMARAQARVDARARELRTSAAARPAEVARGRPVEAQPLRARGRARAGRGPTWPLFAAFALGAATVVSAQVIADRGVELALLAAVIAGVQTLAAALPRNPDDGKGRTRKGSPGR